MDTWIREKTFVPAIYVNDISLKLKWKNNKRYKLNIEIIKCKKRNFYMCERICFKYK